MILMVKATINLATRTKNLGGFVMSYRRPAVFFLTMAVGFAMLIFSHALFGGGKDSVVAKSVIDQMDSVTSETQVPDPHGKSNH